MWWGGEIQRNTDVFCLKVTIILSLSRELLISSPSTRKSTYTSTLIPTLTHTHISTTHTAQIRAHANTHARTFAHTHACAHTLRTVFASVRSSWSRCSPYNFSSSRNMCIKLPKSGAFLESTDASIMQRMWRCLNGLTWTLNECTKAHYLFQH